MAKAQTIRGAAPCHPCIFVRLSLQQYPYHYIVHLQHGQDHLNNEQFKKIKYDVHVQNVNASLDPLTLLKADHGPGGTFSDLRQTKLHLFSRFSSILALSGMI